MKEARKEEAATEKQQKQRGRQQCSGGKGGEETAEKRDKAPAEVTNWEKAVALVMADFGEEMMAEEATS